MNSTNHKSIQPLAWFAAIVTDALAWSMALTLWLAPRLSRTKKSANDPQSSSPAPRQRTSSPVADDEPFNRSYDERFSNRYFGRFR